MASRRPSESSEPSRAIIHLQSPAASQPASAHASRSPSRSPQASRSPSQQRRAAADPLSALISDVRLSPQRKPRATPRSPSTRALGDDAAPPTHQVTFHHEAAAASAAAVAAAPAIAAPASSSSSSSASAPSSQPLSQSGYVWGPRSPIEGASIFSMLTVNWATPLVVLGNKRPLDDSDVPELPAEDNAAAVYARFQKAWDESRKGGKSGSMLYALRKGFGRWFAVGGLYCALSNIFLVLQPIFVGQIVGVLRDDSRSSAEGYAWCAALIAATLGSSMFLNQQFFANIRAGNAARVALITAIYEKSLRLSRASRQLQSTGATINLQSNDASRVFDCALFLHFIYMAPLIIAVALALMIAQVGVAAIAGVALLCLLSPLQAYTSRLTARNRRAMLKFSDQRVKLMNEILQGVRVVKLYSSKHKDNMRAAMSEIAHSIWEAALAARIEQVRVKELELLRFGLYLQAMNQTLLFVTPAAVAAVIMCTYAALGNEVNATNTFSILAFLNIIRNPTILIPMSITALAEAKVSCKRIATFLELEELPDKQRKPKDDSIPHAIAIRNASFAWSPGQPLPTLREINLTIPSGSLVGVIGLVGSGKTSLVSAMLGEMLLVNPDCTPVAAASESEEVLINGSIAYVSQESWIRNDTVRGNILFGLPFEEARYAQVLEAACLKHDLSILPQGDLTEIGERGINLSGGQRSRVSVARALYRHRLCDIYLMDDPFAAVDMTVGAHIFQHALQGMLKGKTRVVVLSSHLHLLEHFDQIIVMEQTVEMAASGEDVAANGASSKPLAPTSPSANPLLNSGASMLDRKTLVSGRIVAVGTFAELKGKFASLMSQRDEEEDEVEVDAIALDEEVQLPVMAAPWSGGQEVSDAPAPSVESQSPESASGLGMEKPARARTISGQTPRSAKRRLRPHPSSGASRTSADLDVEAKQAALSKAKELEKLAPKDATVLIEKEDRAQGAVGFAIWAQYFSAGDQSAAGVAMLVLVMMLFLLSQIARVGCDTWLSIWSAQKVFLDKPRNFWIAVYFLIVALTLILATGRSFNFARNVAIRSSKRIHSIAFGLLMRGSIPLFYDVTPLGRILNRFSKDLDQLDTLLPTVLFQLLQNVFILLGVVGVCIAGSPFMAALFLPIGFLFWAVQRYFRNSQRELKRIENTTRSPIFSLFSETLNGLAVIRAYGVQSEFRKKNNETVQMNSKVFAILWWSQRWIALRLDYVSILVVVGVSFLVVGLRSSLSVGVASLALVYSLQLTGLLQLAVRNSVDAESYLTSVERLMAFKHIVVEAPAVIAETAPPKDWPQRGEIEIVDLQLRYRPNLPLVLKGVSCRIQPQEKIGICGRTGSGKSSLLVALFRLVEAASGSIFIDGVNIATIGLDSLRSKLSIIPQDPVMFSDSLRVNLDPFTTRTDAEIHEALQRVHLSGMVASFPDGLSHEISEGGENLSQGQRQLVCIARALLRNSRIIVLDEATSSVDAETDALIQTAIRDNFKHATVLTIAHRIETIVDSDRIMLLDDGKLAEFDSPSKLLSEPSQFRQLVLEGGAANLARLQALARDAEAARVCDNIATNWMAVGV